MVLIVGSMVLRGYRLAEPYQMHFDEVYHARTATEFLQAWRYGISHDIYEWTHPHLAKYAMAGGLVLWGQDNVSAMSDLGVPVVAATVEPRRVDELAPGDRAGERLHVATGTEIRTYDLTSRALISTIAAPGAIALAIDGGGSQLVIGYEDGRLATIDLAVLGEGGVDLGLQPTPVLTLDHPIQHLFVSDDGAYVVAASSDRATTIDLAEATATGSIELPDIVDLATGGSGSAIVANVDEVTDHASAAAALSDALKSSAADDYQAQLDAASPGTTIILDEPPASGDTRNALDAAIAIGKLPGISVGTVSRVAVATSDGVAFIDPERGTLITTIPLDGGAHGLASVTGLDSPRLYATAGTAADPKYDVIAVGGDPAKNGPTDQGLGLGLQPLPGPGTWVVYDEASQMVHIFGLAPGATAGGPWTVYVVEPHGNAVFADARLPDGFVPTAWGADFNPDYPSDDRQQLLVFDGAGAQAAIDTGSHAFAWRLPGVIAGALTAALLFLLARILFRRRLVAALVAPVRRLRRDVLRPVADRDERRLRRAVHHRRLYRVRRRLDRLVAWQSRVLDRHAGHRPAPRAGARQQMGGGLRHRGAAAAHPRPERAGTRAGDPRAHRDHGRAGLHGHQRAHRARSDGPGLRQPDLPRDHDRLHPAGGRRGGAPPDRVDGRGDALRHRRAGRARWPRVLRRAGDRPAGPRDRPRLAVRHAAPDRHRARRSAHWSCGPCSRRVARSGFGPLATPPAADDPIRLLEPPGQPPEGWLRPGSLAGIPVVWMAACLIALPVVVYVISYIPWALIENHQLFAGWPPGHTGQTLLDLTGQMYAYHNNLSSAHPASSPWWAWPMNLKPVWFYQESLAGGTSAALYDAGSLVIWWMGIPALAFVAWMAFRRRSIALTLIAVGFAAQWIPWARIDRAAFQYHYYTALPFVVLALAYFVAEIWHGASRHAWALARIAGAVAIVMPAAMWLLHRPLCAFVGVESVNPGSQACPAVIPEMVLTSQTIALVVVVAVGLVFIVRRFLAFQAGDGSEASDGQLTTAFRSLVLTGVAVIAALVFVAFLPDARVLVLTNIPVEPIALLVAIPLGYLALQVYASRDARRYVAGLLVAVVAWFAILYPNISALPLPSAVVAAYQGILPTYLYAFQFPVSTVTRNIDTPLLTPMLAVLTIALVVTCLVVAYSAWVWRLALADKAAAAATGSSDAETLARSGGA